MAPHPLRRLAASGLTYQAASLASGVLALVTLPLYTRHLESAELGAAEVVLSWIILVSILLRAGLQEAMLRYWFHDDDPWRRARLVRLVAGTVLAVTTLVAALLVVAASPVARVLLDEPGQAGTIRAGALGVWAFTNLEVANALLRAREARATYLRAALTNVGLTVLLTIVLVVPLDGGAPGYLLGNYVASALVLGAIWWSQRAVVWPRRDATPATPPTAAAPGHALTDEGLAALEPVEAAAEAVPDPEPAPAADERPVGLRPLLRFGLPTVPPEAVVFLLNVVDRQWLVHASSVASVGAYSVAGKLATVVIVVARAFQAAWPPLAYELAEEDARRAYAIVVRAYVIGLGWVVACLTLMRHAIVAAMGPEYATAVGALPWLCLGWALWGLTWVFTSLAAREHVTGRTLPAAILGLVVNVGALALLVPSLGATGAAIALVAAYVASLVLAHLRTRELLAVPYERARIAAGVAVLVVVAVGGDWALGPDGIVPNLARAAVCLALLPALVAAGAVGRDEARGLGRALAHRAPRAQEGQK